MSYTYRYNYPNENTVEISCKYRRKSNLFLKLFPIFRYKKVTGLKESDFVVYDETDDHEIVSFEEYKKGEYRITIK